MRFTPGAHLGPYEITGSLGSGGMGEVYRARDTRLERAVAVKILPPQFSSDPVRKQRFEREAKTISSLNHPHICVLHDVGSQDGVDYLVMECVEGETLAKRLEKGPLALEQVLRYGAQIADALDKAHRSGVVHRDLKPGNIMLTPTGAKLLDFGLAKAAAPLTSVATVSAAATLDSPVTEQGTVVGTFQYMSPEQVEGKELDGRSDIFSLGAVLYEMVTGKRAFEGKSRLSVASAILEKEPAPIGRIKPMTPPTLERIVHHCLEKDPEERFQSGRDLAFNLQSISGAASQAAATAAVPPMARAPVRVAAVAASVMAVLAIVFWAGWSLKPASSPTFKQLTFRRGTVTAARFAPDGQNIIYSAVWEGNPRPELFSTRTDGVLSRPLDVSDSDLLAISPQGEMAMLQHWRRTIGFQRQGMLERMGLSGGAPKEMLDGVHDADWSRDGRLAIIRSDALFQYRLEFPAGQALVTASSGWLSNVRVAPGQQHIAFFEHPLAGDDRGNVCVVDVSGHKQVLSTGWSSLQGLGWSVSGKEVWFTGSDTGGNRSLYAVSLAGRLRPILRVPGSMTLYDIAPDGRVLLAQSDSRLVVLGLTPGRSEERDLSWLDWSSLRDLTPDGRWFLFDEESDGGGPNYSIYVRKSDGSPAVCLGDNDAYSISADGKWVLAGTTPKGGSLVLLPTGAGQPSPIKTGNLQDPIASFLPDGKHILILDAKDRVYVQSLQSDAPRPVTPPGVVGFRRGVGFTADGKYALGRDEQQEWALYPIEGGRPIPLPKWTAGDVPVNHTTDNHSFFVRNGDLPVDIHRFDFLTGTRQFVRQLRPADAAGMNNLVRVLMTPDGKYYVYGGVRELSNLYAVSGLK